MTNAAGALFDADLVALAGDEEAREVAPRGNEVHLERRGVEAQRVASVAPPHFHADRAAFDGRVEDQPWLPTRLPWASRRPAAPHAETVAAPLPGDRRVARRSS